jgi:hypothetical protein
MQQLQPSNLERLPVQSNDESTSESLKDPARQLPSLSRRIELWSGRLAMFGLTTMVTAIALKAH